ncbi:TcpK family conjugal transfer DNA-binding protein [Anaeromicropila populeti]|uniref:Uncharacterized protein n=2 Tax=Anaeromicropila populeti TaxID=37658 RepID=A0A1I6LWY9_9FIRM|nr:hypothetical protein SAMN05661086_03635 [Anaeromicropila populeti]
MLLAAYVKEFVAICDYLAGNEVKQVKGYFIAERARIEAMLDRNKYDTCQGKLKVWKQLNWIDAEENRYTKRVYDMETKKYIRRMKLSVEVYKTLKELNEK